MRVDAYLLLRHTHTKSWATFSAQKSLIGFEKITNVLPPAFRKQGVAGTDHALPSGAAHCLWFNCIGSGYIMSAHLDWVVLQASLVLHIIYARDKGVCRNNLYICIPCQVILWPYRISPLPISPLGSI